MRVLGIGILNICIAYLCRVNYWCYDEVLHVGQNIDPSGLQFGIGRTAWSIKLTKSIQSFVSSWLQNPTPSVASVASSPLMILYLLKQKEFMFFLVLSETLNINVRKSLHMMALVWLYCKKNMFFTQYKVKF